MATTLSNGYIYFIESQDAGAAGNDFIVDDAGDPDDIDLDNYTEGTDYCKLEIPREFQLVFNTGIEVEQGTGANSYDSRSERRWYDMFANGIETSLSNGCTVMNFFMLSRHTSGSSSVFKRYYLIIRFAASNYATFIDASGNSKEYCPGVVGNGNRLLWNQDRPLNVIIRLQWRSVW